MLRRLFSIFLLACAVLFVASGAEASVSLEDPLARELKQKGDREMVEGDYEDALSSYERATAIEQHPGLLYNRARALQALERYTEALKHFEAFRRQAPEELLLLVPQLDEMIASTQSHVTTVRFTSNVKEAVVTVRGQTVIDAVSEEQRFDAGPAKVVIRAKGYQAFEKSYAFVGGSVIAVEVKLIALSTKGVLRIDSQATAAEVLIDDKSVGMVPVEVTLEAGPHTIIVRHPEFQTTKTSAVVAAGQSKKIQVDLEARPSVLKKWWFWASVGSAAVIGTSVAIALTTERSPDKGDIPPGTISVPIDFR